MSNVLEMSEDVSKSFFRLIHACYYLVSFLQAGLTYKEAAATVHREAHSLEADEIIEVQEGLSV